MALPTDAISMSQVNTELGLGLKASISLGQANVRFLAGREGAGTRISMSDLRGKSSISPNNLYSLPKTLQGTAVISNNAFFIEYEEDIFNNVPAFTLGGSSVTSNNDFFVEYNRQFANPSFTLDGSQVTSNNAFFIEYEEDITNSPTFTLDGTSVTSNNDFFIEYEEDITNSPIFTLGSTSVTSGATFFTEYEEDITNSPTFTLGGTAVESINTPVVPAGPTIGDSYEGGFYAGDYVLEGQTYELIMGPRSEAFRTGSTSGAMFGVANTNILSASETDGLYSTNVVGRYGFTSPNTNSHYYKIRDKTINGKTGWYYPSKAELEVALANLHPTTTTNPLFQEGGSESLRSSPNSAATGYFTSSVRPIYNTSTFTFQYYLWGAEIDLGSAPGWSMYSPIIPSSSFDEFLWHLRPMRRVLKVT